MIRLFLLFALSLAISPVGYAKEITITATENTYHKFYIYGGRAVRIHFPFLLNENWLLPPFSYSLTNPSFEVINKDALTDLENTRLNELVVKATPAEVAYTGNLFIKADKWTFTFLLENTNDENQHIDDVFIELDHDTKDRIITREISRAIEEAKRREGLTQEIYEQRANTKALRYFVAAREKPQKIYPVKELINSEVGGIEITAKIDSAELYGDGYLIYKIHLQAENELELIKLALTTEEINIGESVYACDSGTLSEKKILCHIALHSPKFEILNEEMHFRIVTNKGEINETI